MKFVTSTGTTLAAVLSQTFANPRGILFRLRSEAELTVAAQEDVVTRTGHIRLSVHRSGVGIWLWRVESLPSTNARKIGETPALPLMITGRRGVILFMNEAARQLVGTRLRSLSDVFPNTDLENGQLVMLATPNGKVATRLALVDAGVGRKAIYLIPVDENDNNRTEGEIASSLEELPVPLLRVSVEGEILSFNPSASLFVGASLEIGCQLSDLMEGLGRPLVDWLAETASGRAVQKSEFLQLKRTDKEVFVQVALNRVN